MSARAQPRRPGPPPARRPRWRGPSRLASLTVAVVAGAAALLGAGATSARADEPWRPAYQKDGLSVFTRPVAGSPLQELRAVQILDFPATLLFATVADVEAYPREMPPTVVARRLRSEGDTSWYYVEISNSIISRRYYCSQVTLRRLPGGALRSEWTLAPELCPAQVPGKVQMLINTGSWTFTPVGEGRTEAVFTSHADPGGSIPAWMVNRVAPGAMPETFANLRRAAQRRSQVAHK